MNLGNKQPEIYLHEIEDLKVKIQNTTFLRKVLVHQIHAFTATQYLVKWNWSLKSVPTSKNLSTVPNLYLKTNGNTKEKDNNADKHPDRNGGRGKKTPTGKKR